MGDDKKYTLEVTGDKVEIKRTSPGKGAKSKKKAEEEPEPKKKNLPPVAYPSKAVEATTAAIATKTTSKYIINSWWHLKRDQEIIAPKVVIDVLRNAGFVK